jgi:hypothetical protein
MRKNYIGISRDHSGSMSPLRLAATKDYNSLITEIRNGAEREGIDTVVSVIKCGSARSGVTKNIFEVQNSSVNAIRELKALDYDTDGSCTPLFDSIGDLIEQLEKVPDANDTNVTFLIAATTDGEDNRTIKWTAERLRKKIEELQATDRWSFIFRVPRGYETRLAQRLGIPQGNILSWELSERGVEKASTVTRTGMSSYYSGLSKGVTATRSFFAVDMANIDKSEVKATLTDISREVEIWSVSTSKDSKLGIRPFCQKKLGRGTDFIRGAAFYELVKTEEVQEKKLVAIREKKTGKVYAGDTARDLLGLPRNQRIKVKPENSGDYDVFVQSTSVNRVLPLNTKVLYWPDVRAA